MPVRNHAERVVEVLHRRRRVKTGKHGFPAGVRRLNGSIFCLHGLGKLFPIGVALTVVAGFVEQLIEEGVRAGFQKGRCAQRDILILCLPNWNGRMVI